VPDVSIYKMDLKVGKDVIASGAKKDRVRTYERKILERRFAARSEASHGPL